MKDKTEDEKIAFLLYVTLFVISFGQNSPRSLPIDLSFSHGQPLACFEGR